MKTIGMKTVVLPAREKVPALGLGTWYYGEDRARRDDEIATLRLALDLGITLIDTAEMYGSGAAEKLIGEAIGDRRDEMFLVSKVLPQNASLKRMPSACEGSLRRLGASHIDLYLLHWRGSVPLAETLEAFSKLQASGKIRHYGVSNFDTGDMQELWSLPGGTEVQTNQVLYNLAHRGIEWDLLPWSRERKIPVMAYSPIGHGELTHDRKLIEFAQRYGMTPVQIALAWLLANDGVIAIPKTSRPDRLEEARGALEHRLTKAQLAELDELFPPPSGPRPLEML